MRLLLKNPLTIWFKWLIKKIIMEIKFKEKHLKIGYLSTCIDCKFGLYNTIYNNVLLNNVEIGDFTYIFENTLIIKTKIGKFCSIGPNVKCGLEKHPTKDYVSTHPIFYSSLKQAQITFADKNYFEESGGVVEIGNDVWIGANVIIKEGVRIGDGAIISAGAVVTKDVSPYAMVGGVPAKLIRYRFSEDQIAFLMGFKWWDRDIDWLMNNFKVFHDIQKLMNFMVNKQPK